MRGRAAVLPILLAALACSQGAGPPPPPDLEREAGIELARIGTIEDYPSGERIVVNVDVEARLLVEGRVVELGALPDLVAEEATVVVRADHRVPWGVTWGVLRACATRTVHVHFAVRPPENGEEGVLSMRSADRTRSPDLALRTKVLTDGSRSDPASLFAEASALLRRDPDLPGTVEAPSEAPTGYVLRVVDALCRAGGREITFRSPPPPRNGDEIAALLRRASETERTPGLRLRNETLAAEAEPMPPVPRRRILDRDAVVARLELDGRPDLRGEEPLAALEPLTEPPPSGPTTIRDVPVEPASDEFEEVRPPNDDLEETVPPSVRRLDTPVAGVSPSRGAFGHRTRRQWLAAEGGAGTQLPLDLGLEWLKVHQDPAGHWDADGFEAQCKLNKCGGPGAAEHDPGVTGLALLAYLGAGQTHKTGRYRRQVRDGLKALRQKQDPEGCFGSRRHARFVYDHACASLAVIEAYAMTGSPLFKASAQSAVDFIERCRNPYLAWRYGVRPQDNDTSVTAWMALALRSAKTAGGLRVPTEAFEGARAWMDKVTDPETGRVGYTARGTGPNRPEGLGDAFPPDRTEATTAMGVLTRILLGEEPRKSELIQKGVELCLKSLPEWDEASGSIDMIYWHFGTLALFQVGDDPWKAWNTAMKTAIVDHQRKDGDQRGSWDPIGPWGREGGRVMSTALMTLCLESYYRYARLFSRR